MHCVSLCQSERASYLGGSPAGTLSPAAANVAEAQSTLPFAAQAQLVQMRAVQNLLKEAEESELVVAGEVVAEVMEREAPSAGEAMGSVEYLGRWKEKRPPYFPLVQRDERAMPVGVALGGCARWAALRRTLPRR